jgi:type I restriction enzyme, S subunit
MTDILNGYKQTEVGVIPEDWSIARCSEITALIGKGSSPKWQGFQYSDLGMLFVTSENVRDGFLDVSEPKYLPLEFHEKLKRTKLQQGDILINLVGASIGRSCRITQELGDANINQAVAVFRLIESDSGGFVSYLFQSQMTIKRIMDMQVDAARPNISLTNLREFLIPLPPSKAEQEAIAEALSDADALIDSLEQLITKKRHIKQGAMQELLNGKKRLPGFSGEWEMKRLGDVADSNQKWSFTGGPFGSNLKSSDYVDDGVRIIQLQNIGDGEFHNDSAVFTSQEKADELLSSNIYPGEIILSKMGDPVARACIIPSYHERYLMCSDGIRLAVNPKRFNTFFVYISINAPDFRTRAENAGTGSTRKRIGLTELRNLELLCPGLPEQSAIATILSDMDAKIAALETKLAKTRSLKQGMMHNLLTGRIGLIESGKLRMESGG